MNKTLIFRQVLGVIILWCAMIAPLQAQTLSDRLAQFPHWSSAPRLGSVQEDLLYPAWMAGTWQVSSTLEAMEAPLAPEVITPGFGGNRRYLHQPLTFSVRFVPVQRPQRNSWPLKALGEKSIVADRQFNGENILKAYVGQDSPLKVRVDRQRPNQQTTLLPDGRQLISVVTARGSEWVGDRRFIGSELVTQFFRTTPEIYLNGVETTTAYDYQSPDEITATQLTAVYLSPQDPDYFTVGDRPVALYRYGLTLRRSDPD